MGFLERLARRVERALRRRTASEREETEAEDAARKYWKHEVTVDKERRGTPDKQKE